MSKPDPAGGSLEAILASIRKGLAEQATGEQPRAPSEPEADVKPARRHGLTQRLAGTAPSAAEAPQGPDDLSDLLQSSGDSPLSAAPSTASPTQAASPAPEDPLWFLTRREEPKAAGGQSLLGPDPVAAPTSEAPAAEPSLTRPEVLRASMPPFFGSSESATVTPPPTEAAPPTAAQPAKTPPAAAPASPPPQNSAVAREVSLVAAAAAEAAATRVPSPSASGLNGAAAASGAANISSAPGDAATNRALEAVVLELLKPMLRQWLDENMPRLVAQAISDEAVRARLPDGAKKP